MDGTIWKNVLNAGADIVTVLAAADNDYILTLKAVKEVGKRIVVDLICVDDFEERVTTWKIGVNYIRVHTGSDTKSWQILEDLISQGTP